MNTDMPKTILFLDAYFFPENTSYSHLEKDLIETLVQNGYFIEVVCPRPTRNISEDEAKNWKREETLYKGRVHVTRFPVMREKKNPILRALRYFLCNRKTYQNAKKIKNIDAVFCNSTPPIQGLIARKLKRFFSKKYQKEIPFIYNLQDMFPDSLLATGLVKKNSLLWKIGSEIERKTYAAADHIIVISNGFRQNIMEKGVSSEKISAVYNWVDLRSILPVEKQENPLYAELGIDPKQFCVVYAGNFGASQGIETILQAAELLKAERGISFLLFGGGAAFKTVCATAEKAGLSNVYINKLLPAERTSQVYSLGDVCIISCKKGAGERALPSKTWSILACNRPIIASFDRQSELEEILVRANAGLCVEPENPAALANAVKTAYSAAQQGRLPFATGRTFVEENASKEKCTREYLSVFQKYIP